MVMPKINIGPLKDEIRVTSRKADFVGTPTGLRKERWEYLGDFHVCK